MKVSWDDYSRYMVSHKTHVPNHQPLDVRYHMTSMQVFSIFHGVSSRYSSIIAFPTPTRDLDLTPTHESPITDQGDTAGSPDLGLRSFNNKISIPIDSTVVVDFLLGKCRKSSTNKPSLHSYWPTVRTLRN